MKQLRKSSTVLFSVLITIIFLSCRPNYDRVTVIKMLESSNPDSILQGCRFVLDSKDTTYIDFLLKKPYQYKVTFDLRYKGMNGYQGKMQALETLSGIKSPIKITSDVDSSVANFYHKVLKR